MTPLRNAMTIDVEDWFHVEEFSPIIAPELWGHCELRVAANVEYLLEALDTAHSRATFFVLGWVAERLPEVVKRIAAVGHEIASHGWSHAPIWRLTPGQFFDEVTRSRRLLCELSGQSVLGYRAPTFSVVRETMWALRLLVEAGHRYDSSIFPIRHDLYGIPDAPLQIYRHEAGIWEMPMSVWEVGRLRVPVAGGGYLRLYPRRVTERAIRAINRAGRPAVVYIHPWEFDPDQPRVSGARLLSSLRHYVGIGRNRGKLAWLLREFPFTSANEVLVTAGADLSREDSP
jgi:polysaccharide deacetylase family protein (PEP-CTERM system associated)